MTYIVLNVINVNTDILFRNFPDTGDLYSVSYSVFLSQIYV